MSFFRYFILVLTMCCTFTASASLLLNEWIINTDGNTQESLNGDALPGNSTLDASGLGEVSFSVSGAGQHFVKAFFDFEFTEGTNTFFNEFGASNGTLAAGQSFEIDEPGFIFGDIVDNVFVFGDTLDNSNAVPASFPDDVSFALGWSFTLAANQSALVSFTLSDVLSTNDFYLSHTDPDVTQGIDTVFFWSDLNISSDPVDPPTNANAPATLSLLLFGALMLLNRKRYMCG